MKFKNCSGIIAAALVACQTMTFAYQKADPSQTKAQGKPEQMVKVEFITPDELKAKIAKNESLAILDLRAEAPYSQSDKTIKGSLHTKVRKVVTRLRDAPRDKEVITYCACTADEAATIAARALLANGFTRVRVLKGGWNAWLKVGGQVEPRPL